MYKENLASKQAVLHDQRHARRRRRRILLFLIFLVLVCGFFYIIRKPFLRVGTVTVEGSTLVNSNDIKEFVEQKLSGYQLFLIPRNSVLFLKRDEIESQILVKFPRLSKATIVSGTGMYINVSEPIFENMYCMISVETKLPIGCALLHPDGKLGSIAPKYSYSPFFTFYKSGDVLPELGTTVISSDELARVSTIKEEVRSYNIPVIGFFYGFEYDELLLDTGDGFSELPRIRLLFGAQVTDIKKTLGIASEDTTVKKLLIDNLVGLDYVDLRFNGQVVYKKK